MMTSFLVNKNCCQLSIRKTCYYRLGLLKLCYYIWIGYTLLDNDKRSYNEFERKIDEKCLVRYEFQKKNT